MPESRLAKTRRSLPEGYQFGDARPRYDVCPKCMTAARLTRGGMQRCDDCRISWLPAGDTLPSTPLTRMYDHDFTTNRDLGDEA